MHSCTLRVRTPGDDPRRFQSTDLAVGLLELARFITRFGLLQNKLLRVFAPPLEKETPAFVCADACTKKNKIKKNEACETDDNGNDI